MEYIVYGLFSDMVYVKGDRAYCNRWLVDNYTSIQPVANCSTNYNGITWYDDSVNKTPVYDEPLTICPTCLHPLELQGRKFIAVSRETSRRKVKGALSYSE